MARPSHHVAPAALLLAAAVALASCGPERDWNPEIRDAGALAGEWRDGPAVLRLGADGRYECAGGPACDPLGAAGAWRRSGDFFVAFRRGDDADGRALVEWRVSRSGGRFRLAAGRTRGDPDDWSPRLTFEQVPAAT